MPDLATLAGPAPPTVFRALLSMICSADRIVALDADRVVESGTHDELVAADGYYARLVASQRGGLPGMPAPVETVPILSGVVGSVRSAEPVPVRGGGGGMGNNRVGPGRRRSGPVYDDAMKVLADDDLDAVLSLVGVHGKGAQPLNTELPGSSMRADLLARTPEGIVHVEFVKDRSPNLDLRMVEYWLRVRHQERDTPLDQYVLVLGDDVVVPDRCVDRGREVLSWSVVRLGDLDPEPLLERPTTAAIAALCRGTLEQRAAVLTVAAELIAATDSDRGRTLLDAATILASIVLPAPIIDTALKEATVPVLIRDTPLGREIYEEGLQEGRAEGVQEGARLAVLRLTGLMLRQRFGDDPRTDAIAERLAALPDEQRLTRIAAATGLDELEH